MSDIRIADRFVVQTTLETSKLGQLHRVADDTSSQTRLLLQLAEGLEVDDATLDAIVADNATLADAPDVLLTTEWGADVDRRWLLIEGAEGSLLSELLAARTRTDMPALLHLGSSLGRALEHAASANVRHLDLGPHRVALDGAGLDSAVRVFGFGWWRLLPPYATGASADGFYGLPEFMAAEVCKGRDATASSDLYSAALVIWALAAGKPPFRSSQPLMTLKRQAIEKPLRLDLVKPALKGVTRIRTSGPAVRTGWLR